MGRGSFLHGGRWNAVGSFRAVYGSTADTVAVAEWRATADYALAPQPYPTPRLLVAIEFSLQVILDLTSAAVRRQLGLTLDALREVNGHLTQAAGRAVFEHNGEGLLCSFGTGA